MIRTHAAGEESHVGLALVTGASSGIGAAFARALAARGYDVLLVARREERLRALAAELDAWHGRRTAEALAADLAVASDVERLAARVSAGPPLHVLVNCAGFGTAERFADTEPAAQARMVLVHDVASVLLTRAALPAMVRAGRGAVINVASPAAFVPTAGNVTYSASKAFLVAFSRALAQEVAGAGVRVQVLVPGFTRTEFHDAPTFRALGVRGRVPRALWMDADRVAEASLAALGRPGVGRLLCVPGRVNRLIVGAARLGLAPVLERLLAALVPPPAAPTGAT